MQAPGPAKALRDPDRGGARRLRHPRLLLQRLFGSPGEVGQALGAIAVNGWANLAHVLVGTVGLLAAGFAARRYALWLGAAALALAAWGFAIGDGSIVGLFPVNAGANALHLAIGLLGVGAALGSARRGSAPLRPVPDPPTPPPLGQLAQAAPRLAATAAAHLEQDQGAGGGPSRPTATTGRTQLRGSRRARSSLSERASAQSESSSAAAWVIAPSVSSTRPESRSGGSIGRSASASIRSKSLIVHPHLLL